jgi:predicted ATP-dependent endonuclease of OLD family
MKLKSIKIKNFHRFVDLEIEFNSKVTKLRGVNGAGKTSILNAIWATFKGIASKSKNSLIADRYRLIGNSGKSTDLQVSLIDEKACAEIQVTNKITKSGNQISFKSPSNYELSPDWLSDILSVTFMSAKSFCALSGVEQSIELGIDTSTYDDAIKGYKEDLTGLNRELKALGTPEPIDFAEKVSVSEILKEISERELHNSRENTKLIAIENKKQELEDTEQMINEAIANKTFCSKILNTIEELKEEMPETDYISAAAEKLSSKMIESTKDVMKYQADLKVLEEELSNLPTSEAEKPTTELNDKLMNSEATNLKAEQYEKYQSKLSDIEAKKKEITKKKDAKKQSESNRITYIKSFDFGFEGLTVDEKGSLMLDDGKGARPIKEPYFSRAQLEIIVARLHSSVNPELKVRWIDDFNLLDDGNQTKIVNELIDSGFQVITAEVGKEKAENDHNVILIKDCEVVESYDDDVKKPLI